MNRLLFFLIVTLVYNSTFGQNPSFNIIFDSIYPLVQQNRYQEAKKLWIETEEKYKMDQQEKLRFMECVLRNKDIKYFKKEIVFLMKESGYYLERGDTISISSNYLTDLIKENGLTAWVLKKSKKLHPKWIWKKPTARLVQLEMDYYQSRDQHIIKYAPPICYVDSFCVQEYDEHYANVGKREMAEFASFCNQIGGLPNNIDHGINVLYRWQLVFRHCIENSEETLLYAWDLLKPFIDQAYFDGKIDANIFYTIDMAFIKHFGSQYFGLVDEIPIYDPETFETRTNIYNF